MVGYQYLLDGEIFAFLLLQTLMSAKTTTAVVSRSVSTRRGPMNVSAMLATDCLMMDAGVSKVQP